MASISAPESCKSCPKCQEPLFVAGQQSGELLCCSQCQAQFLFGQPGQQPLGGEPVLTRLAIFSFGLGLGSLFCLFLTGIPAIALGIAALRKIRRRPETYSGRGIAWTGIATGSVFGLLCGGGLVGLTTMLAMRAMPVTDPAQIQQAAARIGQFDLPPGFQPRHTLSPFFGMRILRYVQEADSGARTASIEFHQYPANMGPARQHRAQHEPPRRIQLERTERLKVMVLGKDTELIQQIGKRDGRQVTRYVAAIPTSDFSLIVVAETTSLGDAPPLLTEEHVRKLLEGYQPPKPGSS